MGVGVGAGDCFSGSEIWGEGEAVGERGTGSAVVGVCILVELGFVGVPLEGFCRKG